VISFDQIPKYLNVEVFGDLVEGNHLLLRANDEIKPGKNVVAIQ
jgi:hypothetical protein